ncbi:hypothetical protein SGO26_00995 [Cupriavidus metallidurans]|nr:MULTISPECIES: hypothetical protein [Cupriavidus]
MADIEGASYDEAPFLLCIGIEIKISRIIVDTALIFAENRTGA